jgi:hypothetical protein
MADEITIQLFAQLVNGLLKDTFAPGQITPNQTTQGMHSAVVVVGFAAEEDLTIGDVATAGWIILHNLDSTNFVTYGPKPATMEAFGKLNAGEFALFYLASGVTLRWQANTANVKVKVHIWEV